GWVALAVPDHPGEAPGHRIAVRRALTIPGVAQVLAITVLFVLAHNILYTYIAPLLAELGMAGEVDRALFVFGIASAASLWFVGLHIDGHLRRLTVASVALFAVAATLLAVTTALPAAVYAAATLWGLGFGGTATLLQTGLATAAGPAADTAQAALVTLWNSGIAGGAVVGGALLTRLGPAWLPRSAVILLAPALLVVVATQAFGGRRAQLQGEGGNQM
ncbi:MFS transporter, partial [Kitasatospora sp. NPDC093558]